MDRVNLLQEYFCTQDEGMGTAYERYALNKFLDDFIKRYKIESVIEVPANGVMGIPGLKSMLFAMAGCKAGERAFERYWSVLSKVRLQTGGEDVKEMGLEEGPMIGKILRSTFMAKINGEIKGKDAELATARALVSLAKEQLKEDRS